MRKTVCGESITSTVGARTRRHLVPGLVRRDLLAALLAAFWGFVGGASLLLGALVGLYAGASQRIISLVMAVGAGVLISSVAFELMEEAYRKGGFDSPAIGMLLGALIYFAADLAVSRRAKDRKRSRGPQRGARARRSRWGRSWTASLSPRP